MQCRAGDPHPTAICGWFAYYNDHMNVILMNLATATQSYTVLTFRIYLFVTSPIRVNAAVGRDVVIPPYVNRAQQRLLVFHTNGYEIISVLTVSIFF